jgi:hypothetical protein
MNKIILISFYSKLHTLIGQLVFFFFVQQLTGTWFYSINSIDGQMDILKKVKDEDIVRAAVVVIAL